MCRIAKYMRRRGAVLQEFDKTRSKPSMTQDLYMQRNLDSSGAAEELRRLVGDALGMTVNVLGKRWGRS